MTDSKAVVTEQAPLSSNLCFFGGGGRGVGNPVDGLGGTKAVTKS